MLEAIQHSQSVTAVTASKDEVVVTVYNLAFGRLGRCYIVLFSCDAGKMAVHAEGVEGAKEQLCLVQTEAQVGKMSMWRCHPGMLRFILMWVKGEDGEVQRSW